MNRVETFYAKELLDLEELINKWCQSQKIEPLSASIAFNSDCGEYIAAVVVREIE